MGTITVNCPCACGQSGQPFCSCTLTGGELTIAGFEDGENKWYASNPQSTAGGIRGTSGPGWDDSAWWKFPTEPQYSSTGDSFVIRWQSLRSNLNGTYSTAIWNGSQLVFEVGVENDTTDPGVQIAEVEWWAYCDGNLIGYGLHRQYIYAIWANVFCSVNCEETGLPVVGFRASGIDWDSWLRSTTYQLYNPCHTGFAVYDYDGEYDGSYPILGSFDYLMPMCTGWSSANTCQGVLPIVDESPDCGWANYDADRLDADFPGTTPEDCCTLGVLCNFYEECTDLPETIDDVWHCCGTDHPYADNLESTVSASLTIEGHSCPVGA